MNIGAFSIWTSARKASEYGCTNHGRLFGLVPGFVDPTGFLWVPRSDLLNPVEDVLGWIWSVTRQLRGEEPDFMIEVGRPIS